MRPTLPTCNSRSALFVPIACSRQLHHGFDGAHGVRNPLRRREALQGVLRAGGMKLWMAQQLAPASTKGANAAASRLPSTVNCHDG